MTDPSFPGKDDLRDFVYDEARMLDEQRFDQWLDLFSADGIYWMPLEHGQTDPDLTTSLLYEDRLLLQVRVQRLQGERTYAQKPKSRCHHVLQRPFVDEIDPAAGHFALTTPFHYVETRRDEQNLFAGWASHQLVLIDGELKIKLKRVDLVNCDAAFGNIQLFM